MKSKISLVLVLSLAACATAPGRRNEKVSKDCGWSDKEQRWMCDKKQDNWIRQDPSLPAGLTPKNPQRNYDPSTP